MALSNVGAELPEWLKANYREMVERGTPAEQIAARIEQQDGPSSALAGYVRSLTVAERGQAPRGRRSATKDKA